MNANPLRNNTKTASLTGHFRLKSGLLPPQYKGCFSLNFHNKEYGQLFKA